MGGEIRLTVRFPADEDQRTEVRHEKAKEDPMAQAYEDLRMRGFSFEEIAEANIEPMLNWKLGSMFDRDGSGAAVARLEAELAPLERAARRLRGSRQIPGGGEVGHLEPGA